MNQDRSSGKHLEIKEMATSNDTEGNNQSINDSQNDPMEPISEMRNTDNGKSLSQSLFFFSGDFVQKNNEGNNGSNKEVDASLLIDNIETFEESELSLRITLSFDINVGLVALVSIEIDN